MESFTDDIPNVTEGSKEEVKDGVDSDDTGRKQLETARLFWNKITGFKDKPKTSQKEATDETEPGTSSTETTDKTKEAQDAANMHWIFGKISDLISTNKTSSNESGPSGISKKTSRMGFKRGQDTENGITKEKPTPDKPTDKDGKVQDTTNVRLFWSKIANALSLSTAEKPPKEAETTSNTSSTEEPEVQPTADSGVVNTKSDVDETTEKSDQVQGDTSISAAWSKITKFLTVNKETPKKTEIESNAPTEEIPEVGPAADSSVANTK
ncbi:hypothetical protein LSH36_168g02006 [Paralvinella palmiformis]|uniref:Uncharacterized protein n=1 Tax=Paralvinella palmiformis TaxID=53620 RepID=A0AAD9JSA4_9ANNE|nr:hypothetical protein LSH36_168g02006 [Paralvinella palmiformis]